MELFLMRKTMMFIIIKIKKNKLIIFKINMKIKMSIMTICQLFNYNNNIIKNNKIRIFKINKLIQKIIKFINKTNNLLKRKKIKKNLLFLKKQMKQKNLFLTFLNQVKIMISKKYSLIFRMMMMFI